MASSSSIRANSVKVDASTFGDLESALVHGAVVDCRHPHAIRAQFGRNFASSLGAHTFSEEDHEVDRPMFRATGISVYLENGGTLEHAQQIAAHESARTTKLYDRTSDQITLDEVERIAI